ncbi:MAG: N-acetyltransferase [Bacteroidetes bacterium]|nr:MAG: N-acetyltransferase [Bacteroidota bacterium]
MNSIAENVSLGSGIRMGHGVVIEDDVRIGDDCVIGHYVVIRSGSTLGNSVRIDDHASIGKLPMKAANSAVTKTKTLPGTEIGNGCIIGSGVVIYAGAKLSDGVLVADLATIREDVSIGEKTILGRGVAIENQCSIGSYCKLETNAYITAYSTIEDYVFVAPGVLTSNDNFAGRSEERFKHFKGVTVRRGGRIGVGAVILPGCEIAEDGMAAAGSVVTKDIDIRTVVAGIPARSIRAVEDDQLLDNQSWFDDSDG